MEEAADEICRNLERIRKQLLTPRAEVLECCQAQLEQAIWRCRQLRQAAESGEALRVRKQLERAASLGAQIEMLLVHGAGLRLGWLRVAGSGGYARDGEAAGIQLSGNTVADA